MIHTLLEPLEARCLLSAASFVNVIGQYTATASVTFTPAKAHAPASDNVTLTIGSESAKRKLGGTISDSFGQSASVAGSVTAKDRVKLHIVTDRKTSDESGTLAFTLSTDETTLTGRWREHNLTTQVTWGGSLTVHRPASDVTPANFVGLFSGIANGNYSPDVPSAFSVPTPYTASSSITITTESEDGSVRGSISGFGNNEPGEFITPVTGSVVGDTITLSAPLPEDSSITATLSNGRLEGNFSITNDGTQYWTGTFTFSSAGT
ncbi:MAG TPA: hypothetical protein VHY37_13740 [Tepidisphaeraceae bacterium]|jgi:hypothetical protein|nr:hypothetical protein [Tepidisphaeraceae bacterium]